MALYAEKYSVFLFTPDMKIIPFASGIAELEHGQEYQIGVFNHDKTRDIDADIEIRGRSVGSFRVKSSGKIVIERSSKTPRKLTFYAANSEEGILSNLEDMNCLESLVVTIAVQKMDQLTPRSLYCSDGPDVCDGFGGTGLGARSSQRFVQMDRMRTESERTVLIGHLKLKETPKACPL